jgi:hypothetical protein
MPVACYIQKGPEEENSIIIVPTQCYSFEKCKEAKILISYQFSETSRIRYIL